MSAFSGNVLSDVSPGQIRVMLDILSNSSWRKRAFVERRYRERARNFDATLVFLKNLGWVRGESDELRLVSVKLADLGDSEHGPVAFLDALLGAPGNHRRAFARYLSRFSCVDGSVSFSVRGEQPIADIPVRDFLMELGAVRFDPATKAYILELSFVGAYLWALTESGPATGAAIIAGIKDQQRLGLDAELAVVAFERERLGPLWADRVDHVAGERPASPYDISSVTVTDGVAVPRYVEVKAVSPLDFEFHWSTSEIEIARLLGKTYHLYLLPASGLNDFDLARLQIIADPFASVYSQPTAWEKRPTHFICRPVRSLTS